jgi:hypothetical protein
VGNSTFKHARVVGEEARGVGLALVDSVVARFVARVTRIRTMLTVPLGLAVALLGIVVFAPWTPLVVDEGWGRW